MRIDTDIRSALENPDASATLLHAIVRRTYGEDWYIWDPVTVEMELSQDFSIELPVSNMDKLCAMQVLITSGSFFSNVSAFMAICGTFSEGAPMFDVFNPTTTEEVAWGLTEAALNRELLPFSEQIKYYVRQLLKDDGYAEEDYPAAIRELLMDSTPDSIDVRRGLASVANASNLDSYINEQLHDFRAQFNKIDSMPNLAQDILEYGFMDAVVRGRK